jgi:hypothetical protein
MVRMPKLPDLSNLTTIPIHEVPDKVIYTPWPELYKKVPPNQAVVFTEKQINPDTTRAALIRYHDKKEFMNIEIRVRGPRGKRTVYLLNHGKDKEE